MSLITPSLDTLLLRCANTDMRNTSNVVMGVLNSLQDRPHDEQIMAIGVLFLCLCTRYQVSPSLILNYADNLVKKSGGYAQASFEAVKAYLKNELED